MDKGLGTASFDPCKNITRPILLTYLAGMSYMSLARVSAAVGSSSAGRRRRVAVDCKNIEVTGSHTAEVQLRSRGKHSYKPWDLCTNEQDISRQSGRISELTASSVTSPRVRAERITVPSQLVAFPERRPGRQSSRNRICASRTSCHSIGVRSPVCPRGRRDLLVYPEQCEPWRAHLGSASSGCS